MHYVHNPLYNTTTLIALMEGGIISSYTIDKDYHPENRRKVHNVTESTQEVEPSKPLAPKRRSAASGSHGGDKLAAMSSLLNKLLDEDILFGND